MADVLLMVGFGAVVLGIVVECVRVWQFTQLARRIAFLEAELPRVRGVVDLFSSEKSVAMRSMNALIDAGWWMDNAGAGTWRPGTFARRPVVPSMELAEDVRARMGEYAATWTVEVRP